jgi:pyrroline-5-carboxylate reductase
MGGQTARGLLRQKTTDVKLTVSDPSEQVREQMAAIGAGVTDDNAEAARGADVVMVVVKPWLVETVLKGIASTLTADQKLIVIAAGVPSAKIKEWLTTPTTPTAPATPTPHTAPIPSLFLAIPNIAIAQLASMTFLVPVTATQADTACVKALFDTVGTTLLTDEAHLAAGTTLASCGIAYAMRYIRAAAEGGVELGFRADEAKRIVMQTVDGAVRLLQATGMHPEQAIDMVTTPGGVTILGLNEMEHAGFTSAVIRGLKAGAK